MRYQYAGILLAAITLSGCGSDDSSDSAPSSATIYIEGLDKPNSPEVTQEQYCLEYGTICMKYNGFWVPFNAEQTAYYQYDSSDDKYWSQFEYFDVYSETIIDVTDKVGNRIALTSDYRGNTTGSVATKDRADMYWEKVVEYGEEIVMMEDVSHSPDTSIFTVGVSEETLNILGRIEPKKATVDYHDTETGFLKDTVYAYLDSNTPVFTDDGVRHSSFNLDISEDDSVTLGTLVLDYDTDNYGQFNLTITPQDFINNGMTWEKGYHYWLILDASTTSRGELEVSYTVRSKELLAK